MSIIDKTILSKDQPQNTNVLWAKPKDGGGIELNAFNNGKWEKAGGESTQEPSAEPGENPSILGVTTLPYAYLKSTRDSSNLVPGEVYRIIDYQCTTAQADTQSANHQFDILVTALDANKLNESARAVRHDGDESLPDATDGTAYFAGSKLEAWKIWYCLDNDTSRFAWADATNGKGVIYRMIDEYNNDIPYDFKNIQFKRYKITSCLTQSLVGLYLGIDNWTYTRNQTTVTQVEIDKEDSIWVYTLGTDFDAVISNNTNNILNICINKFCNPAQTLNNIHFAVTTINGNHTVQFGCNCRNMSFSTLSESIIESTSKNIIGGEGNWDNCIHANCDNITFGNKTSHNIINNRCIYISLGDNCYFNNLGIENYYITFENNNCRNSFDTGNHDINLKDSCVGNSFGNRCSFITFGSNCTGNSLQNSNSYVTLGEKCERNSFGVDCENIVLGNNCTINSFGNFCVTNSLGERCSSNSFGNRIINNSFGNYFYGNSLGNTCTDNSFGNYVRWNTFGTNCTDLVLGVDSSGNNLNAFYENNRIDDGVSYIRSHKAGTGSSRLQYYHITSGMSFSSDSPYILNAETGRTYETTVARNSKGEVVEYCEADLINTK